MPKIRYTEAQKEEALQLVQETGVTRASEQLGITINTLYAWRKAKGGKQQKDIEQQSAPQEKSAEQPTPVYAPLPREAAGGDVNASYPLRYNYFVSMNIPCDMTYAEARRLSDFIKTLYFVDEPSAEA